jgi:excisionase family DNA binding protein
MKSTARKVEKTFCTTREAGQLLGVSVGTAQLWVENGLLSAWKTPGGHRRVTRESVEKLLRSKSEAPPAAPAARREVIRRLKVLVVEDDTNLLRLYETTLALWPMSPEVIVATNGINALLLIERENPDLLIVDLKIPGIDGFEMLKILQSTPRYAHMALAVVSGLDADEIARRGGVPPGVFVLPKPVPFTRLLGIAMDIEERKLATVGGEAA